MNKDFRVYLDDLVESCNRIAQYIEGLDFSDFEEDLVLQDAVIRRLEIIGEATKRILSEIKSNHLDIPWKKASGLRDILIHNYENVNFALNMAHY